jgi:hypothetical protein
MARDPLDLLYGSLDLLILRTLAWEPMHGYGISNFTASSVRASSRASGVLPTRIAAPSSTA